MAPLYTVGEIVAATAGRTQTELQTPISSVSIDSREVAVGALFVAVAGDRFDGHDFVPAALAAGAAAALVSAGRGPNDEPRLIEVPDALEGLSALARAARERSTAAIVAVTGSAGKTTAKEAIRTVLSAAGSTHASIKSFNNHWGVPLMLARMPESARFGVFEIGMNHAGEITPLSALVRPHIAVITTVAAAHLEFFNSVAAIAQAKAEIFSGIEPGGTALINIDHDQAQILIDQAWAQGAGRVVTYGFAENADWRVTGAESRDESMVAQVVHGGEAMTLTIKAQGRHMVANAVAALAVADLLGVEKASALEALAGFEAPEGRGASLALGDPRKPLTLIDESYNANGASMAAALEVFAHQSATGGAKVLVLGDMLELGERSDEMHRALAPAVLASGASRIYLVGPAMAGLAQSLGEERVSGYAPNLDEIGQTIVNGLAYGDAVMIKGSNGVRLGSLVDRIRHRFG